MNRTKFRIANCFPKSTKKSREEFIEVMIDGIEDDPEIAYAGFIKQNELRSWLKRWIDESYLSSYVPLTEEQIKQILDTVENTILECFEVLTPSELPLRVFLFPWLCDFDEFDKLMGKVTGFTPYANTVHLYISPEDFDFISIKKTLTHELHHAVFFQYRITKTILDALIFEGLAENFEEYITKERSVVSSYLDYEQSWKAFQDISEKLNEKLEWGNNHAYQEIFLGGGDFEKWTGYAVGYYIVKSFLKKNSNLSWLEITKMDPCQIMQLSSFVDFKRIHNKQKRV